MHFEGKTLNSSQWHTLYSKSTTHDFGDRRPLFWCINIVATLFSLCWEPSYSNGSLAGGLLNDLIWDLLMKVSASQMASITLRLEPLLYHLTHSKEAEPDSALKWHCAVCGLAHTKPTSMERGTWQMWRVSSPNDGHPDLLWMGSFWKQIDPTHALNN